MFGRDVFVVLFFLVLSCFPAAELVAGADGSVKVDRISSSGDFAGRSTCAVTTAGGVKCWGRNDYGQLGDGTTLSRGAPVDVVGLGSGITQVATGSVHACALTALGAIKCWGNNVNGELGDGTTTSSHVPVSVLGLPGAAVEVAVGSGHSCALLETGMVACWGGPYDGSLLPALVDDLEDVVTLAAGGWHACAITTSGQTKCLGWGRYPFQTVTTVPDLADIVAIDVGNGEACAVTSGGMVKCWTMSMEYTAWIPQSVSGVADAVTLAVGTNHKCVTTAAGSVQCWGYNWHGQLGDGTTTVRYTPVEVSGLANAVSVTVGARHSCAVTESGGVKCWGSNYYGQLGNGHIPQVPHPVGPLLPDGDMDSIEAGDWYACALTESGSAMCWGRNGYGQLGDGSTTDRSIPVGVAGLPDGTLTTIAPGYRHTCGITAAGGVKCWGDNRYGQLGNGTTVSNGTPVDVALDPGDPVASIAMGDFHTCVLTAAGEVKCWGWNYYGQLGTGDWRKNSSIPVSVSGLANATVIALSAGHAHTCALMASGEVMCWGFNLSGQLGDGTKWERNAPVVVAGLSDAVKISAASGSTCVITATARVKCWGDGGTTGIGDDALTPVLVPGLESVTSIEVGWQHRCALTSAGAVQCLGYNRSGELGQGTTTPSTTPVTVQGMESGIEAISSRALHSCALTMDGGVECWGSNHLGELGIGGPLGSLTPVSVIDNWDTVFQDGFDSTIGN